MKSTLWSGVFFAAILMVICSSSGPASCLHIEELPATVAERFPATGTPS